MTVVVRTMREEDIAGMVEVFDQVVIARLPPWIKVSEYFLLL